jgi:hypothetical protein
MRPCLRRILPKSKVLFYFFFCRQKDSMQRIFIQKRFLFTVGRVCRVKLFTSGSRNSLKNEEVETEMRKWLRQQSKILVCCGFRRTGKAMGQAYQCCWRIRREINVFFFQFRISHILRYISICDLFTDPPSYFNSLGLGGSPSSASG